MIVMSHTYIFQKIWQIKSIQKSYVKFFIKNWTSQFFIKNKIKKFLNGHIILNSTEIKDFKEINWKKWLESFYRYKISKNLWVRIVPNKWRCEVSEYWKKNQNFDYIKRKKNQNFVLIPNLLKKLQKEKKIYNYNKMISSYFDLERFFLLKEQKKNQMVNDEKQKKNLKNINKLYKKKKLFFKYNLLLWIFPEFLEKKTYQKPPILLLNKSVIKKRNEKVSENNKLVREGERNQIIRQWRWKSKNLEKRMKKLGNMASLITFMQNQQNIISLSNQMNKDLILFHSFFRKENDISQLTINSEHRLPRLLDDQKLMYKMINTFLNIKKNWKKMLKFESFNNDLYSFEFLQNNKNHFFNIEDILLSKNIKKFRILNFLSMKKNETLNYNKKSFKINIYKKKKLKKSNLIKRFIWSSYRFEDLACFNRFGFNTNNGSRFSMLRIRIYPLIEK